MKKLVNKNAKKIIKTLQRNGYEAVLAGGCVRDLILEKTPKDWDIATSATPVQIQILFNRTKMIGKAFGVILVKIENEEFEIATFRKDFDYDGRKPSKVEFVSMKEDASRRDFTCNAMFYDPIKDELFDFFDGQKHLEENKLKFVGIATDRIKEDHLRILRAIRFAADLNLRIDIDDLKIISFHSDLLKNISSERIRMELLKILSVDNVMYGIELLQETSIFETIINEIYELKNCEQDPLHHPEGNVFIHTKLVINNLSKEKPLLRLAGLFHDIGKPKCFKIEDGRVTTKGHDKEGAEIAEKILKNLKFSNKEIEYVIYLISNHMKLKMIKDMKLSTIRKMLSEKYFDDLLELCIADQKGNGFPHDFEWVKEVNKYKAKFKEEAMRPEPIINGRDLIAIGLVPSREFGKILNEIYNKQLEGIFTSKNDAKDYILNKFF